MSSETGTNREQNFNKDLAEVLRSMHPDWRKSGRIRAEKGQVIDGYPKLQPDILICLQDGVPLVIETEFDPAKDVEGDAMVRLGLKPKDNFGKIEQAIALKIPKRLKKISQPKLKKEIKRSEFEFCVYGLKENMDDSDNSTRWPEQGWISGDVYDLAQLIELVSQSENTISESLDLSVNCLNKLSDALWQEYNDRKFNVLKQIAKSLKLEESPQTIRIALAIVLNAIMFHKSIVHIDGVKSFEKLWEPLSRNKYGKFKLCEHWDHIIQKIDYVPIFRIAVDILKPLDAMVGKKIIQELFDTAEELEKLGTSSRRDFYGRLFQRLVSDRKYIATFHTLPSAAKLLAETAMDRMDVDWSNADEIKSLKIADFACGTGSLLNASMQSIISRHNRSGGNGSRIHKHLVEEVLVGADIMPAATHLTASILAGMHPENTFERTSTFTLQYGNAAEKRIRPVALGSLDLLDARPVYPAVESSAPKPIGNELRTDIAQVVPDNSCDLVIMNPPFTNPTNHKGSHKDLTVPPVPSFAGFGTTKIEQKRMSERLKEYKKSFDSAGSGQAGLASNFFDIAHKKVKNPNGIIALIFPFTIMRGASWEKVRKRLEVNYTDIVVFSIASTGQTEQAFSANTGMADVLIVARRDSEGNKQPIRLVNLREQPSYMAESYWIAKSLKKIKEQSASYIEIGNDIVANVFFGSYGYAGIKHIYPAETAEGLSRGVLIPPYDQPVPIPTAELGSLGKIGLLYRDISGAEKKKDGTFRGPFKRIQPPISRTPRYPMLWSHDASVETRLIVNPDSEGRPRDMSYEKKAKWVRNRTSSKLHTNRDFRLNSQPLAACMTERKTIGGTAWPNAILDDENWEIPVLLWMNSTLGLVSFWFQGSRQQLGRARMTKTTLPKLTVLDASKLSKKQLKMADGFYQSIKKEEFLPANEAWRDPVRKKLDEFLLIDLLGIERSVAEECLDLLRNQWCDEPSVYGESNRAPKFE